MLDVEVASFEKMFVAVKALFVNFKYLIDIVVLDFKGVLVVFKMGVQNNLNLIFEKIVFKISKIFESTLVVGLVGFKNLGKVDIINFEDFLDVSIFGFKDVLVVEVAGFKDRVVVAV